MFSSVNKEHLLLEVEDVLRTMPDVQAFMSRAPHALMWLGRASAVIEEWSISKSIPWNTAVDALHSPSSFNWGRQRIFTLLQQASHSLRIQTVGPINVAIDQSRVFDYFDELRKLIETAASDLLFVDAYLDADFVSAYLPHARSGVPIRLLTGRKKLATLLPSVDAYATQEGTAISVRSSEGIHDRYLFVDGAACYQSGASFKDGARKAPTTLTQITDAFLAVRNTYEEMWQRAKVER
jgi:hypothetical protein